VNDSLTWAQGYRLGLAHAFGGEPLVADEGFEAGGANSIRGFAGGEVGPRDYPFGRQAVVVLNQELRYRHPSGLGAVAFYDAGNTFATASEFSLRLRHVLGAGLRWSSPVGLLRVDIGAPFSPREGESRYKVFFSFGQAF
jgi:outer membrane protein assembly factor BamA